MAYEFPLHSPSLFPNWFIDLIKDIENDNKKGTFHYPSNGLQDGIQRTKDGILFHHTRAEIQQLLMDISSKRREHLTMELVILVL